MHKPCTGGGTAAPPNGSQNIRADSAVRQVATSVPLAPRHAGFASPATGEVLPHSLPPRQSAAAAPPAAYSYPRPAGS